MEQEKLAMYKQMLLDKKREIKHGLSAYAHKDVNDEGGFAANYEDMGYNEEDNAQEMEAYDRNTAMEATMEEALGRIDRALDRIEKGTYGICIKTGKAISEARLKAMPEAETAI
jgi:RNA polymerase-binding transcription factor DksA